jgi:hypothetical protein
LDQALFQLLLSNAREGVRLSTCNVVDRKRMHQRFAYFSYLYSTGAAGFVGFDNDDECNWDGLSCDANGTMTELYFSGFNMEGPIPADVDLWTALTKLTLEENRLTAFIHGGVDKAHHSQHCRQQV